ncbi:MAG: hypothetical protein COT24_05170 [Candidatus Kerfeldbacteria bacterium CG08_land_8_20_14_0_20_40_16]|uniref:POTRA domain-containing protein n=1 Tax=Candidatus Kerfeldbacteria bacterium CG08_land_8_20_14_0_20_40_16 TaxID=2014244 RepID=A0A2H0YUC4_9BACT|nr:MAG: hypothetical protein COT24_05170 [Candidatus Kerfeldbacteria bacterium CG08_land_8_20_14_0_20_40_16]
MFGRKKTKNIRGFRKHEIKIVNKPVYENPYFKRKQLGFILRHIKNPRRLILGLIILGVIYFFFYSNFFRIKEVEIQGNQELTYDQISSEINKVFVARRLIILPQSNLFVYNTKASEQALWDSFALEQVKIKKRLPDKIVVTLKEKIPNLTFINDGHYYYLDLEGIVTHIISPEEAKPNFPIVEDLNERKVKLKDKILPQKVIESIFDLNENFSKKTNTNIDRFLIPEVNCPKKTEPVSSEIGVPPTNSNTKVNTNLNINQNSSSVNSSKNANLNQNVNTSVTAEEKCDIVPLTQDIIIKTQENWQAFFTTVSDLSAQLERLKIFLLNRAVNKESNSNIDYIDLRFGEKIFLKELI